MADVNIIHNKQNMRFEMLLDDQQAFLEYRFKGNDIAFMHTEVPESMSGKGIASKLAVYAFNYAKENNLPVIVYCPFVKTFLKRHPEYNVQLDPEFINPA
jgi:predicted GNAT family acetyltransferase